MANRDLPFFFFGTLTDHDVLGVVLGHGPGQLRMEPARLGGFRCFRVKGEAYPTLRAVPNGAVEGLLVWDLSAREVARIGFYEGADYRLVELTVSLASGASQAARAFADDAGLETDGDWDVALWRNSEKPGLLVAARAFMTHFGSVEDASVADRRWREARALAQRRLNR